MYSVLLIRELVSEDVQHINYIEDNQRKQALLSFNDMMTLYPNFSVYMYKGNWNKDAGVILNDIHGNQLTVPLL